MGQGVVDGTQAIVSAGEKLLAPSTLLQEHIQRGYVNLRDQSVAVDNVREVYDRAALAATQYMGVQVTANDIANGYIITQDGVAHSLERFTSTAVQATFAVGGQEDANSGLAQSLWQVEAGANSARDVLEVEHLVVVESRPLLGERERVDLVGDEGGRLIPAHRVSGGVAVAIHLPEEGEGAARAAPTLDAAFHRLCSRRDAHGGERRRQGQKGVNKEALGVEHVEMLLRLGS